MPKNRDTILQANHSTSQKPKVTLVIRSSAMGDVIMSAPVLRSFTEQYPDRRVAMLTRAFYAPFFEGIERFEIFNIDLAKRHRGIRGTWKLYRQLKEQYEIEQIVDLNDKLYSRLLRKFFSILDGVRSVAIDKGRVEKKALTRREDKVKVQLKTSVQRYCDTFVKAGFRKVEVANVLPPQAIRPFPEVIRRAVDSKRVTKGFRTDEVRYIALAPFAQHEGKRLPMEKVEHLIALIGQQFPDFHVLVFGGGQAEAEVATKLEHQFDHLSSAIGILKLEQEMDLMANTEVVISMDSSSMHMGSALGVPVVSVWGATHPYAGFLGLGQSAENVVEVETLDCRPCSIYGHKPCYRKDYACLHEISEQDILHKVKRIIHS